MKVTIDMVDSLMESLGYHRVDTDTEVPTKAEKALSKEIKRTKTYCIKCKRQDHDCKYALRGYVQPEGGGPKFCVVKCTIKSDKGKYIFSVAADREDTWRWGCHINS